jgi:predicted ATPase
VTSLGLNRLDRREGSAFVRAVAGNAALPEEVVNEVVERADGVPLFVEELTKAVLEAADHDSAAVLSTAPPPALAVPATLNASLIARLDRLGSAGKEIAQIGAVLGREFSYELIRPVAGWPAAELTAALDRLSGSGLLFCRGTPPHAVYQFKHALVQDAAYGTLLRGPRQLLHGRTADALLSTTGETSAAEPEIIAHHLQSAGRSAEAIVYWREAGERAVRRAANREAIGHLRRALLLLETQPETTKRWRVELAVLSQLSSTLMNVYGWSAPEVGEAIERATLVGHRLESSADLAPSIVNLWFFNIYHGRLDRADEISADLFRIARELDDPEIQLQAHHTAWPLRWMSGQLAQASEHIEAGLRLYDEERHAHHRYVYLGHDPAACALSMDAYVQWALGYPIRAVHREEEAVALARRSHHPSSLAGALWLVCGSQAARGDRAAVVASATELLGLSEELEHPQSRANALISLGWALGQSGEAAEGIIGLREGFGIYSEMGAKLYMTRFLCLAAETYLAAQRYSEGLEHVARALDLASEIGERFYVPRLHHVRAELLLHAHGTGDEAVEASLQQALAAARQQEAKGWELQAATRFGRLLLETGRRDAARDLLAPIYSWFTEGFDTPDLKEAKALLDDLA